MEKGVRDTYRNNKAKNRCSRLDFARLAEQEEKRAAGTYLLCPFLLVLFVLLEKSGNFLPVLLSLLRCTELDSCGYRRKSKINEVPQRGSGVITATERVGGWSWGVRTLISSQEWFQLGINLQRQPSLPGLQASSVQEPVVSCWSLGSTAQLVTHRTDSTQAPYPISKFKKKKSC